MTKRLPPEKSNKPALPVMGNAGAIGGVARAAYRRAVADGLEDAEAWNCVGDAVALYLQVGPENEVEKDMRLNGERRSSGKRLALELGVSDARISQMRKKSLNTRRRGLQALGYEGKEPIEEFVGKLEKLSDSEWDALAEKAREILKRSP